MERIPRAASKPSARTRWLVVLLLWQLLALAVDTRASAWAAAVGTDDPHERLVVQARERLRLGAGPLPPFEPFAPVVVVPNGSVGSGRHGTWPSPGVGEDGNWTRVGIEIGALCGSSVIAAGDGHVVDRIDDPGDPHFSSLGYMVLIEHPEDLLGRTLFSLYLHLAAAPPVAIGDPVEGGQTTLGRVGSTGAADACGLHFELRFFAGRFHAEWRNIFGPGDRRQAPELATDWLDPILFLRAFPEGLHRRAAPDASGSIEPDELLRQIDQQIRSIASQPDYLYAIDTPLSAVAVIWMDWMDRLDWRTKRRADYDAAFLATSDALTMERIALERAKRRVAAGELDLAHDLLAEAARLREHGDAWRANALAIYNGHVDRAEHWANVVYQTSKLAFLVTAGVATPFYAATLPANVQALALTVKTIEAMYLGADAFLAWQQDGLAAGVCKTASSLALKLLISEVDLPRVDGEPGDRLVAFFNEHFAGRTLERALSELPFETLPPSIDVTLIAALDSPHFRPVLRDIFGRATTEGLDTVVGRPIDERCQNIVGPVLDAAVAGLRNLSTTPADRLPASPETAAADTEQQPADPPADDLAPPGETAAAAPSMAPPSVLVGDAVLTGRVRDNFGEPVAGAQVRIQGSALEAVTDADGHYVLPYVPGSFQVAISRPGFDPLAFPLHLTQAARFPVETKTILRQPAGSGIFFLGSADWEPLGRCTIEQAERDDLDFGRAGVDRFVVRGTPAIVATPPVARFLDATGSDAPRLSPFGDRVERHYLFAVAPDGTFLREERQAGWPGWWQLTQERGISPYRRVNQYSMEVEWGTMGAGRPVLSAALAPGFYAIVSPEFDRCFLAQLAVSPQAADRATTAGTEVATCSPAAGDVDADCLVGEAERLVSGLPGGAERIAGLRELAHGLGRLGEAEAGLLVAAQFEASADQDRSRLRLISGLIDAGDTEAALAVSEQLTTTWTVDAARSLIAERLAADGSLERARELVAAIDDPRRRTYATLELAEAFAREGRLDEAVDRLHAAMSTERLIDDRGDVRTRAFADLAKLAHRLGQIETMEVAFAAAATGAAAIGAADVAHSSICDEAGCEQLTPDLLAADAFYELAVREAAVGLVEPAVATLAEGDRRARRHSGRFAPEYRGDAVRAVIRAAATAGILRSSDEAVARFGDAVSDARLGFAQALFQRGETRAGRIELEDVAEAMQADLETGAWHLLTVIEELSAIDARDAGEAAAAVAERLFRRQPVTRDTLGIAAAWARLLARLGQTATAEALLQRVARDGALDGAADEVLLVYVQALLALGDPAGAHATAQRLERIATKVQALLEIAEATREPRANE